LSAPEAESSRRLRRLDESGAAYVEAAIVFAVLAPSLVYMANFGLSFYEWSEVNRLVEAGTFFVSKNADVFNAMDTFDGSIITNAVGKDRLGDSLTITAGCSCPDTSSGVASLTPFAAAGEPKCDQRLQCNGNTTAMAPYVKLYSEHRQTYTFGLSNLPYVSATAIVRIQ
jgi:hypothetical protein